MSSEGFIRLRGMHPWHEPLKPWWLLTTVILWSPLWLKWYSLWIRPHSGGLVVIHLHCFLLLPSPCCFLVSVFFKERETGVHTLTFQASHKGYTVSSHMVPTHCKGLGTEGHRQNQWLINIVINNLCLILSCLKLSLPHQKRPLPITTVYLWLYLGNK